MDVGLLLLRLVVGLLFAGHGLQKLFGWFGGPGLERSAGFLGSLGYRRSTAWAPLHGVAETGGGLLLAAGLLTPLPAAIIVAVMLNAAVAVHAPKGLWAQQGGYEYLLVLATAATAVAFVGPGRLSVDAALGWELGGYAGGLAALGLGLVVGLAVLAFRRVEPAEPEAREADDDARRAA